jgi:hypothetical protein
MLEVVMTFLETCNPVWIFMVFPLLFGTVALRCWLECRKEDKLEDNPHRMTDVEYAQLNHKRFRK